LTLPAPTTIPRRGHYLIVGNAYSQATYAAPNITVSTTNFIADNSGTGLLDPTTGGFIDSLGFTSQAGGLPYIEGLGLTRTGAKPVIQYAYIRKIDPNTGFPIDTDNNVNDFQLVSTTAAIFPATGGGPTSPSFLGAPGPQNTISPVQGFTINPSFVDPGCLGPGSLTSACSLARDPAAVGTNAALGTISIRRRLTNNTGAPVTRLRFRIIDDSTSTLPVPAGTADLRLLTSSTFTANLAGGGTTSIQGLTLEEPPTQANGGGTNSSASAGSVGVGTPLANGASIDVNFVFGVNQLGDFRLGFVIEGLPTGGAQFFAGGSVSGPTASEGNISGVIHDANGNPLSGAVINLAGAQSRKTITDAQGNYRFEHVEPGGFYTVTPSLVSYHFSPEFRSFSQLGNNTDAEFTASRDVLCASTLSRLPGTRTG